jgi:hypothetical protein
MLHIAFALDRHGDALESSDIYAHWNAVNCAI